MGILSGLFRTRDGPKNATSGSAYSFFMGSSAAGKSVNERSAMQMTAVYACVRILSESIAGLPLHMYRYEDDGSKTKAVRNWRFPFSSTMPNTSRTICSCQGSSQNRLPAHLPFVCRRFSMNRTARSAFSAS